MLACWCTAFYNKYSNLLTDKLSSSLEDPADACKGGLPALPPCQAHVFPTGVLEKVTSLTMHLL